MNISHSEGRPAVLASLERLLPGFILVVIVTAAAYGLRQIPGVGTVSPMFSAIIIGMAFASFMSVPAKAVPGVAMLGKKILRLAVALLGLQLTLAQVLAVGVSGMTALVFIVGATYVFTVWLAGPLGVNAGLARLLAAGTSICGASAIAAANAVERADDEDVTYAVACITLFGSLAIVLYPVLAGLAGFDPLAFGYWTGASVHEVAQVVATGFQRGDEAGEFSVVVKLSRVLLLAPLLVIVSRLAARRQSSGGPAVGKAQILPLFVAGFILLMLLNTVGLVPSVIKDPLVHVTPVMLTAALGALGLSTSFSALRARGLRPLLLALLAFVFMSAGTLLALQVI